MHILLTLHRRLAQLAHILTTSVFFSLSCCFRSIWFINKYQPRQIPMSVLSLMNIKAFCVYWDHVRYSAERS
jgi:hypothetical protein